MQNDMRKPGVLLALALLVFVAGGFLLMVHIGVSGRKTQGMTYGFGFRGGPAPAATATTTSASSAAPAYLSDFKKGVKIVKTKGQAFYDDIFSGSPQTPPASGRTASARQEDSGEEDPDGDAFEKYYRNNYAKNYGKGGAAAGSWAGSSGGGSYGGGSYSGGGSSGGSEGGPAQNVSRGASQEVDGDEADPSGAPGPVSSPGAGFGAPAGAADKPPASRALASLPGTKSPDAGSLDPGSQPGASSDYSGTPHKGGGLSGMPGAGAGANLNGADEAMKSGGQTNYNAKMSGGAAAAAAEGGKAAPAASGPKEVGAGDKDAGGNAGGSTGGSTGGGTGAAAVKSSSDTESGSNVSSWFASASPDSYPASAQPDDDQDLVKTVVTDRLNGAEMKFVTEEEAAGSPDKSLLTPGAVAVSEEKEIAEIDPPDRKKLSPERRKELRKEMHAFLKKVENLFGKMTEIYKTPCSSTPDLCKDHGVSGNYLTMTTEKGAKLVLGMKYVKSRWHRYTMDFKVPPGSTVKPPVIEEEEPEGEEEADPEETV